MPWHDWSGDFDFDGLCSAAERMSRVYERVTKTRIMWKEKYGTIRYEYTDLWIENEEHVKMFVKCLKWIIKKEPKFAGELVDDVVWLFHDEDTCNFFKGVVYLHDMLNKTEEIEV